MSAEWDLAALQAEMRCCVRCAEAGYEVAPGAVFSGGLRARWMIVGQAPGETEWASGRPFCGPSGRRLFRWLADTGWVEEEFRATQYITAVTKCFPGKATGGRGDRAPTQQERTLCSGFLNRELELVRPRVILAVGAAAIERFLGAGLLELRVGKGFTSHERIVVPLPHPSGANLWLNRPRNRVLLERALEQVRLLRRNESA